MTLTSGNKRFYNFFWRIATAARKTEYKEKKQNR